MVRKNFKKDIAVGLSAALFISGFTLGVVAENKASKEKDYNPLIPATAEAPNVQLPFNIDTNENSIVISVPTNTVTPTQEPVTSPTPSPIPYPRTTVDPYTQYIEARNKKEKGPYEASVAKMNETLIKYLAEAVREGNGNVPNALGMNACIDTYAQDDRAIVEEAFRNFDLIASHEAYFESMAYHVGPILDTLIKYNVMQEKGVKMENMEFYFSPRNKPNECTAATLQEVRIKNGERVKTSRPYLINGNRDSSKLLVQLSIVRGTLFNVLEYKGGSIGFAEIDNNPTVIRAMETVFDKMPDLIERINSMDIDNDRDEI